MSPSTVIVAPAVSSSPLNSYGDWVVDWYMPQEDSTTAEPSHLEEETVLVPPSDWREF